MFRYRWPAGMWAFLLHRITGFFFTFYLLTHILVMSNLARGEAQFNKTMVFLASPIFKIGECALLACILFHMLNGIRILLFDWADAYRKEKVFFYGLMIIAFVVFVIGAIPLVPWHWLGGFIR